MLSCNTRETMASGHTQKEAEKTASMTWTKETVSTVPVSLTAPDGTGLRLLSFDAKAVVQGPLAFTELHLIFENDENRTREGRFEITLPARAAISRFAMKVDRKWQEAEVVERQRARQTYEDFLHRRQDPALLEKKAGNQFRARVFPIAPKSKKEIIVSWSEELTDTPYMLLVAGLPKVKSFKATVTCPSNDAKPKRYTKKATQFVPTGNLVFNQTFESASQADSANTWRGLKNGELSVVKVVPRFQTRKDTMTSVTVLFDTSASRAPGFKAQVARAMAILRQLATEHGRPFQLELLCFDQGVVQMFKGSVAKLDKNIEDRILRRSALGASNLGRALNWVKKYGAKSDRLIIFTDGIVTAQEDASTKLQRRIRGLGEMGVERVDVVVDGGIRDESLLEALVTSGVKRAGVVIEGMAPANEIVDRLRSRTIDEVAVKVDGANWVWPRQLKGVQSGNAFLIFVGMGRNTAVEVELVGVPGGKRAVQFEWVPGPLIERSSAISQIQMGSAQLDGIDDDAQRQALKEKVVALSVAHRVLTKHTALLVLETEDDYARYKINRNALTDILVVNDDGIGRMTRADAPLRSPAMGRARGEEGQMGKRDSRRTDKRFAIRGPRDNPNPHITRSQVLEMAKQSGILTSIDNGRNEARGTLEMNDDDEQFGYGGLGLSGTGRGGGGTAEGTIGLGNLNSIGRGAGGLGGQRRARTPLIRSGAAMVQGRLSKEVIRRIVQRHINEIRFCYERELVQESSLEGRVAVKFIISGTGNVQMSAIASSTMGSPPVETCVAEAVRRWQFPAVKGGGVVIVTYPFEFVQGDNGQESAVAGHNAAATNTDAAGTGISSSTPLPPLFTQSLPQQVEADLRKKRSQQAYTGKLAEVMMLIGEKELVEAHQQARDWRDQAPGDLLALVALGEAFEAMDKKNEAARAYGSIIDLYPSRADMRRMAGERLERLGKIANMLTIDTYKHAVKQRPDHPASHRLLAWALFRDGKIKKALEAMGEGVKRSYPAGRFRGVVAAMKDEMNVMVAALKRADAKSPEMQRLLKLFKLKATNVGPSTRFILHWESDANDVDLHVYDRRGNHAFYKSKKLSSGGSLAADVTDGYGPEFFTIRGKANAHPYTLQTHYYSRGPMGYGMGTIQTIVDDGKGNLSFDFKPFVVMQDGAYVGVGVHDI